MSAGYWEGRYRSGTTGWDRGDASPALDWFLSAADRSGWRRVLVPGCGRGHEVLALARAGLSVTAIDFASDAVEDLSDRLQQAGLTAKVRQGNLLELDDLPEFDAIYEQTCLCAMPPEFWPDYEIRLRQWLRPEGGLFALFMQTTQEQGPPFRCPLSVMRQLFSETAWRWHPILGRVDHPAGMHEWACLLTRKANVRGLT